jgi:hypothetical protein
MRGVGNKEEKGNGIAGEKTEKRKKAKNREKGRKEEGLKVRKVR